MYGGDDSYVDEPCFAIHGAVPIRGGGSATAVGRILSIRYQDACIDDFPPEEVRIIAGNSSGHNTPNNKNNNTINAPVTQQQQQQQSSAAEYANLVNNTDPSCPVSVVFIERASSSSSSLARREGGGGKDDPYAHLATIVHAYTPTPSVSEYLKTTGDPVLIEDAAFLSFLIAGGSDATSSLLLRSGFHKRLKPIHEENLRLKAETKALRSENNQLRSIVANMNSNSYRNTYTNTAGNGESTNAAGSNSVGTSSPYRTVSPTSFLHGNNTTTTSSQRGNITNATKSYEGSARNYDDDSAISVHSPLLWETETEAAVNARTRYNPYRSEEEKARRSKAGAGRHAESVSQLIARLHDKSCDDRDKRLASYEAAVVSENERYTERKTLSYDEQKELGTRLHDVASTKKKKILEALETTLYPPKERRTFDSEAIAKSNERIYREPMDKKQKGLEKLIQTYVYDHEDKLPKVKLTKEQQQAMADRLSQRNR